MENSPGENGSRYTVVFTAEVPECPLSLASFELPFHFYNDLDVDNQRKMSELSRKKDELTAAITQYKEAHQSFVELQNLFITQILDISKKESALKNELNRMDVQFAQPLTIQDFDIIIKQKAAEAERMETMPRRVCNISSNFQGHDVIGMVGHLAFIVEDDVARVISWHLGSDIDCVITRTTEAARRIYSDTRGNQQVMALDSLFVQQGDRPLPHIRSGQTLFDPPGNPIYAKDCLIFTHEMESCEIVFKTLLGNTILMDNLESATNYRKAVVGYKIQCPTILTRQGDRVSSSGKFGGAQNRAPPIDKLKVFGAPLPQHYFILKQQLDLLCQYRSAVVKREQAENERNNHSLNWNSVQKQQKAEEKIKQLEEIDKQLVLASRQGKRGPANTGEPSGIWTKRPRWKSTYTF